MKFERSRFQNTECYCFFENDFCFFCSKPGNSFVEECLRRLPVSWAAAGIVTVAFHTAFEPEKSQQTNRCLKSLFRRNISEFLKNQDNLGSFRVTDRCWIQRKTCLRGPSCGPKVDWRLCLNRTGSGNHHPVSRSAPSTLESNLAKLLRLEQEVLSIRTPTQRKNEKFWIFPKLSKLTIRLYYRSRFV